MRKGKFSNPGTKAKRGRGRGRDAAYGKGGRE